MKLLCVCLFNFKKQVIRLTYKNSLETHVRQWPLSPLDLSPMLLPYLIFYLLPLLFLLQPWGATRWSSHPALSLKDVQALFFLLKKFHPQITIWFTPPCPWVSSSSQRPSQTYTNSSVTRSPLHQPPSWGLYVYPQLLPSPHIFIIYLFILCILCPLLTSRRVEVDYFVHYCIYSN